MRTVEIQELTIIKVRKNPEVFIKLINSSDFEIYYKSDKEDYETIIRDYENDDTSAINKYWHMDTAAREELMNILFVCLGK